MPQSSLSTFYQVEQAMLNCPYSGQPRSTLSLCLSPCLCSRLLWLQAITQSQPKLLPRVWVSFQPTVRRWKTLQNASTSLWSKLTNGKEAQNQHSRISSSPLWELCYLERILFCQTLYHGDARLISSIIHILSVHSPKILLST